MTMQETKFCVNQFLSLEIGPHKDTDKLTKFDLDSLSVLNILSSMTDITGVDASDDFVIDNNTTIHDLKVAYGVSIGEN